MQRVPYTAKQASNSASITSHLMAASKGSQDASYFCRITAADQGCDWQQFVVAESLLS